MPGRRYGRTNRAPSSRVASKARRNRRYIKRNKSAQAQQKQLLTVNKNIRMLTRAVGLTKQHAQYTQCFDAIVGYNVIGGPAGINPAANQAKGWNIFELICPGEPDTPLAGGPSTPGWTPIFQSTAEVGNANKFYLERSYFKLNFMLGHLMQSNTAGVDGQYLKIPSLPREITLFVVQFKPDAFNQARRDFFNAQGYWDGSVWNAQTTRQYWSTSLNFIGQQESLPMLNPAVFNIITYKRFVVGQVTTEVNHMPGPPDNPIQYVANPTSNIRDNYRTIEFSIPGSGLLKSNTGLSGAANKGKWEDLLCPELPRNDRKFLLVHVSGNSHQDGTSNTGTTAQCHMTAQIMHTGKGTN